MFPTSLDSATHLVQLALTPIFLLTGLASLLNVFSTRLGRVADRVDKLTADAKTPPPTKHSAAEVPNFGRRCHSDGHRALSPAALRSLCSLASCETKAAACCYSRS